MVQRFEVEALTTEINKKANFEHFRELEERAFGQLQKKAEFLDTKMDVEIQLEDLRDQVGTKAEQKDLDARVKELKDLVVSVKESLVLNFERKLRADKNDVMKSI